MANRTVDIGGGAEDYDTLNEALSTEDDTYADLATNEMILTFDCYNFEDTTAADTGTGYTVSADYYINIVAHDSHGGKWSTSSYRLSPVAGGSISLILRTAYTRIIGVQISCPGSATYGQTGIYADNITEIFIDRVIIVGPNATKTYGDGYHGILASGSTSFWIIRNALIYDFIDTGNRGISSRYLSSIISNCTVVNCTQGYNCEGAYAVFKNCLAVDCTDGFYVYSTGESNYNASDIASDAPGANSVDLSAYADTDIFFDPDNDDFHLKAGSPCINVGVDLYATFTDDIDGETRPTGAGTWDIGADEYIAADGGSIVPVLLRQYRARRV